MPTPLAHEHDPKLAKRLILDELFDLSLYKTLRDMSEGEARKVLDELIHIEAKHLAFWEKFFGQSRTSLDLPRRLKLWLIAFFCRIWGSNGVHLVLEAIEIHGIRKYLGLWRTYKDGPMGEVIKGILYDEFKHEDVIVTKLAERKINPERVRNIFLGLNDGLVEILGAVSGFFGAFGAASTVLIAAFTTAVAGSLSMAAGAYVALNSEEEVKRTALDKARFLGEGPPGPAMEEKPMRSAWVVGASYFLGAMVPVLPVSFGASSAFWPMITAGSVIIAVSMILAFLSGMDVRKRIGMNLIIVAAAVGITYVIGRLAMRLWGVSV